MKKFLLLTIPIVLLFAGCSRQDEGTAASKTRDYTLFSNGNKPIQPKVEKKTVTADDEEVSDELDFIVENSSGKTIYVACFSYIQKEPFVRWRWDKSPIYQLGPGQSTLINVDTIDDTSNRGSTYGYLAVFTDEQEAHDSIFELIDDKKKIDLDHLKGLKDKKVVIGVEKYGFKEDVLDFEVADLFKKKGITPELDFVVENRTGKTIFVTGFVYEIKDEDRWVWRFDKTPVLRLENGKSGLIDVDTIPSIRNRENVVGYLGIFQDDEEQKAHDATYELLEPKQRLGLDHLIRLRDKKVVLEVERYGAIGSIMEFDVQPASGVFSTEKWNDTISAYANTRKSKSTVKPTKKMVSNRSRFSGWFAGGKSNKKTATKGIKKVSPENAPPRKNRGTYQFFA